MTIYYDKLQHPAVTSCDARLRQTREPARAPVCGLRTGRPRVARLPWAKATIDNDSMPEVLTWDFEQVTRRGRG